jgi:hypothetical protein
MQSTPNTPASPAGLKTREDDLAEALSCCERWFAQHCPTAPLINGWGDAEHPMLTFIRATLKGGAA